MRLDGKIAVITGAAAGIGRSMATRFAAEGASVIAADRHEARLAEVVAEVEAAGGRITGLVGDISEQTYAESLVDRAIAEYGRLDVLVNNAGIMDHMAGVGEMSLELWRTVLAVNLDGPMYTSRRAVPPMLAQGGGAIINVASIAGMSGGAAGAAYTTSKFALVGLTRNTAWMYAPRGIRCNAICPGATATSIAETMPADQLDPAGAARAMAFGALVPAQLQPVDIAELAIFLASDAARYINGAVIPADGGWMAL